MTLSTLFMNAIFSRERLSRIIPRFAILAFRLQFPWIFKNHNYLEKWTQIPQPHYFNVKTDSSIIRTIRSTLWVEDMNSLYNLSDKMIGLYQQYQYDDMTTTYYPTKNSAMESVNQAKIWKSSWYNPNNLGTLNWTRQSDALFADMMTNTQGIYKAKKVHPGTPQYEKVKKQFGKMLDENRKHFKIPEGKDIVDTLIGENNLFYMDYPGLREMVDDPAVKQAMKGVPKYEALLTSNFGKTHRGYLEIPFAIFSELPNYVEGQ